MGLVFQGPGLDLLGGQRSTLVLGGLDDAAVDVLLAVLPGEALRAAVVEVLSAGHVLLLG